MKVKQKWCTADNTLPSCKCIKGTKACFGPHETRVRFNSLYLECLSKKEVKLAKPRIGTVIKIHGLGVDVEWDGEGLMTACLIDLEELKNEQQT